MNAGEGGVDHGGDWRARALVIADGGAGAAAQNAVATSAARLVGTIGWGEAIERFDLQAAVEVVLAETEDVPEGLLDRVLPRLEAMARGGDTWIVVSLAAEQIDMVAAQLSGPNIDLLCRPTAAERVGAVMIATSAMTPTAITPRDHVHEITREAESARLQRLNEEVARIAETLARLTRDDATPASTYSVAERSLRYAAGPRPLAASVEISARDVRNAIRARRMRDQLFGGGLFEDPAWDMLLDLFAAELERTQVSVSSLCIAAAVAPTTALRWIARMTEAGLFERKPDPFDRRRAFMVLSERASAGLRDYVAALGRAGLTIA